MASSWKAQGPQDLAGVFDSQRPRQYATAAPATASYQQQQRTRYQHDPMSPTGVASPTQASSSTAASFASGIGGGARFTQQNQQNQHSQYQTFGPQAQQQQQLQQQVVVLEVIDEARIADDASALAVLRTATGCAPDAALHVAATSICWAFHGGVSVVSCKAVLLRSGATLKPGATSPGAGSWAWLVLLMGPAEASKGPTASASTMGTTAAPRFLAVPVAWIRLLLTDGAALAHGPPGVNPAPPVLVGGGPSSPSAQPRYNSAMAFASPVVDPESGYFTAALAPCVILAGSLSAPFLAALAASVTVHGGMLLEGDAESDAAVALAFRSPARFKTLFAQRAAAALIAYRPPHHEFAHPNGPTDEAGELLRIPVVVEALALMHSHPAPPIIVEWASSCLWAMVPPSALATTAQDPLDSTSAPSSPHSPLNGNTNRLRRFDPALFDTFAGASQAEAIVLTGSYAFFLVLPSSASNRSAWGARLHYRDIECIVLSADNPRGLWVEVRGDQDGPLLPQNDWVSEDGSALGSSTEGPAQHNNATLGSHLRLHRGARRRVVAAAVQLQLTPQSRGAFVRTLLARCEALGGKVAVVGDSELDLADEGGSVPATGAVVTPFAGTRSRVSVAQPFFRLAEGLVVDLGCASALSARRADPNVSEGRATGVSDDSAGIQSGGTVYGLPSGIMPSCFPAFSDGGEIASAWRTICRHPLPMLVAASLAVPASLHHALSVRLLSACREVGGSVTGDAFVLRAAACVVLERERAALAAAMSGQKQQVSDVFSLRGAPVAGPTAAAIDVCARLRDAFLDDRSAIAERCRSAAAFPAEQRLAFHIARLLAVELAATVAAAVRRGYASGYDPTIGTELTAALYRLQSMCTQIEGPVVVAFVLRLVATVLETTTTSDGYPVQQHGVATPTALEMWHMFVESRDERTRALALATIDPTIVSESLACAVDVPAVAFATATHPLPSLWRLLRPFTLSIAAVLSARLDATGPSFAALGMPAPGTASLTSTTTLDDPLRSHRSTGAVVDRAAQTLPTPLLTLASECRSTAEEASLVAQLRAAGDTTTTGAGHFGLTPIQRAAFNALATPGGINTPIRSGGADGAFGQQQQQQQEQTPAMMGALLRRDQRIEQLEADRVELVTTAGELRSALTTARGEMANLLDERRRLINALAVERLVALVELEPSRRRVCAVEEEAARGRLFAMLTDAALCEGAALLAHARARIAY